MDNTNERNMADNEPSSWEEDEEFEDKEEDDDEDDNENDLYWEFLR